MTPNEIITALENEHIIDDVNGHQYQFKNGALYVDNHMGSLNVGYILQFPNHFRKVVSE